MIDKDGNYHNKSRRWMLIIEGDKAAIFVSQNAAKKCRTGIRYAFRERGEPPPKMEIKKRG